MCQRLTGLVKRQKYPSVPDYRTENSELFSLHEELACFAHVTASSTLQQRRASGLSFFLGPNNLVWIQGDPILSTGHWQIAGTIRDLFEVHANRIHVFVQRTAIDDWFDVGIG